LWGGSSAEAHSAKADGVGVAVPQSQRRIRGEDGMSETLRRVQTLVLSGDFLVSDHGYEKLNEDGILPNDAIEGIVTAVAIEDYPDRIRGPSVLTLQHDAEGRPIHVVWAIPAGERRPAVLVTAYRPDPDVWDDDFKLRIRP
jgi:Domain of unknown function (DUF4258)